MSSITNSPFSSFPNGMFYSADEVKANYPDYLTSMIERTGTAFEDLPVLDLQGRCGWTGYIDFLKPDDLSAPIMRFTDAQTRPGIALRVKVKETSEYADFTDVIAIFKRDSTYVSNWVTGNKGSLGSVLYHRGDRQVAQERNLHRLPESLDKLELFLPQILAGTDPDFELA